MKKLWVVSILCMLIFMTACSNDSATTEEASGDGKTEVIFWHSMSGELERVVQEVADGFNAEQDEITVTPVFQGTYEEAITKFNTVAGTEDAPAIMQTFEVGTKYMIDSGKIQPVQKFIDDEGYDMNQWEKNITNYYAVDDTQYSMPFNSSTPVLIYNKDAFKEAGLDPEKAPETYSELKEAAKKLTNDDQVGFSILNYGWFIEELIAVQGGLFVDNDNGRTGNAEKAVFNGEEGLKVFELISEMHKEGTFYNTGQNWDDIRAAFQSGKIAMYLDSSAGIRATVDNAPFEVGAGYLPVPDGVDRQGVIIGGASLWMAKDIDEEKQRAAWEFMKYVTTPEVQAQWHLKSGYFSINPAAYDLPLVQEEWEKYPQLKVTVDQLKNTIPSEATQGALISVFPEARQKVVSAMGSLYQGVEPKEALDRAAAEIDQSLEAANRKNGSQ
ncbi:ABC transporter substrate-binding protein [Cytobacillus sp. FSL K6-0265]|uniref:ABC transporter substrate-binding protein n=1 Tax=Cytobacillus sp. FSL K6-0265 TaxID=2921448 RepID=UPI0030F8A9B2